MMWRLSHRFDPRALPLADRHYNRRKVGSPQFVPPGRCLVLLTEGADALWVTSAPFAQYVRHRWAGAWVNSLFRRESGVRASDLIREAVAASRSKWPDVPALGIVSFIDPRKTERKRQPGRCYLKAGWRYAGHHSVKAGCAQCDGDAWPCGLTKGGLVTVQQLPHEMPAAAPALGLQSSLFSLPGDQP